MILVISHCKDGEATTVLEELERLRADVELLDLSGFPQSIQNNLYFDSNGGHRFFLRRRGQSDLDFSRCRAVWWRRPQPFEIHPELRNPEYRNFAYNESYEAFMGLWNALDVFWINNPTRDEVAHRKVLQLCVAQEIGLTIPRTLISNDVEKVKDFVARQGSERTVYKAFSATQRHWRETRVLKPDELNSLDSVRFAPVIFQEYVPAEYDLRITVVGNEIFPAAIYSQETSYKMDFRMDYANAVVKSTRLPDEVETGLRELMQRLGLVYGAIDMRLTPDGQYVFIEINPAGQWLFIEGRTGQSITSSIAHTLMAHDE